MLFTSDDPNTSYRFCGGAGCRKLYRFREARERESRAVSASRRISSPATRLTRYTTPRAWKTPHVSILAREKFLIPAVFPSERKGPLSIF